MTHYRVYYDIVHCYNVQEQLFLHRPKPMSLTARAYQVWIGSFYAQRGPWISEELVEKFSHELTEHIKYKHSRTLALSFQQDRLVVTIFMPT